MCIRIQNLSLSIGGKKVCESLTVEFKRGESWAVLGVNGVGKSTLLHHIIDVHSVAASAITIDEKILPEYKHHRKLLAQKTGILLQDYEYNFPCSVLEAVLIGRHPFISHWQWESADDLAIAELALQKTGLHELKDRNIDTLSGGEKRRLNLATLLTQNPDYLLLDEPTNHLDIHAQMSMLDLISNSVRTNNKTAIMVMHDANLAIRYCDNVLMLFGNGEWQAGKTRKMINVETLTRLYDCPVQAYRNHRETVYLPG